MEEIVRLLDLGADIDAADWVRCVSILHNLCRLKAFSHILKQIGFTESLFCREGMYK